MLLWMYWAVVDSNQLTGQGTASTAGCRFPLASSAKVARSQVLRLSVTSDAHPSMQVLPMASRALREREYLEEEAATVRRRTRAVQYRVGDIIQHRRCVRTVARVILQPRPFCTCVWKQQEKYTQTLLVRRSR